MTNAGQTRSRWMYSTTTAELQPKSADKGCERRRLLTTARSSAHFSRQVPRVRSAGISIANSRRMAESSSMQSVSQRMEVLAALEPSPFPVISLYLSLSPIRTAERSTS